MQEHLQRFEVPFGRSSLSFELPAGMTGSVARSQRISPLSDVHAAIRDALEHPLGSPSLTELAGDAGSVCIAVTDATRSCPDAWLVPPMLAALEQAGVSDEAITVLVAVGTHRASTVEEKREKLGNGVVDRYRVIDHDAGDLSRLVAVAEGPEGLPFTVNRTAIESDLLIATGRVEPHQYAGFSGGGKTVAIGCAGEAVISYTHGPAMLDHDGVRLAELERNPFQTAVRLVARAANLRFVANVVLDDDEQLVGVAFGAPEAAQDYLATLARKLYTVQIPSQVDIAIAGVGYPKDANLYQASRAASYLQFAPTPVVRKGGVIIIPAQCPEGAGDGTGERRFEEMMSEDPPAEIIRRARAEGVRPGEQRAYIMARVLEEVEVIVAGMAKPEIARRMGLRIAETIEQALVEAATIVGDRADVLVVPHALLTLPVVTNGASPVR